MGDDRRAEFEEGSWGRLDVGEDLAVVGEFGQVPDEPDHLGLEEVDFSCFLVLSPQVWLSIHWCGDVGDQIRRHQYRERYGGGEKAGGDPGRVFGTGGGEDEVDRAGVLEVGDAVGVDRVGRAAPSLNAAGDVGGVRRAVGADGAEVAETVGEAAEELVEGVGEADRGKDTGAEHRVAREAVEKDVFGALDVADR